jgi:signal transduction histidine kinase
MAQTKRPSAPPTPARISSGSFALHAAAVVALALWVRTLSPTLGAFAAALQLIVAVSAGRGARRVPAAAFAIVAVATATMIFVHQRAIKAGLNSGPASTAARAEAFERALAADILEMQRKLEAASLAAASGGTAASALPDVASDAGVAVYAGNTAVAWAGRTVIPTESLWERAGVVVTPFYVVQYAAALRDNRRAVAVNVVHAQPPANRVTAALSGLVSRTGTVRFDVTAVPLLASPAGVHVDIGGSRLAIRASPRNAEAFAVAAEQTMRARGAALLLLATLASLATLLWRAERLAGRLAAAAIPLAALAITPLNALSNVTRLFDPATYFVAGGGPYTASVGALAIASALFLFVVMAAVRLRARPRHRLGALLAALVVAGAGPYLLRHLARGVNLPPAGASTGLWLAWEVALFLAATSFLTLGVSAGQWALGAKRGLPLWLAPVLAAIAALLGPLLLLDDGVWPPWYPAIWVVAIAALVLGRRSRLVLFSSVFVAACGATVLLWGTTLRERVVLATTDVAGLSTTEPETFALLDRLADDVLRSPPPVDRDQLLARYAASDLAAADYPVILAFWPDDAAPTVLSLGGDARTVEVADVVAAAKSASAPQVQSLPSNPAAAAVLAVPFPDGGVFTAVVGARTRLTRPQGFSDLFGLPATTRAPPYDLAVVRAATTNSTAAEWRRVGTHLHSEWHLPSGSGGPVHVRADVTFDQYETLVPLGVLIVLFNFAIALILLGIDLLTDGVLARWLRARRERWQHSYRLQLTFALFAFFMVPALAFATWSYRRLQVDDRAARELLVRETLRRAVMPMGSDTVGGVPQDVPLLIYRRGQLVATRDSLVLSVAPVGRWLDPVVRRLLSNADELVATTLLDVGDKEILFGFRELSPDVVAAVPARRDDAALEKRRSDLGVLVILATVLGGLAALGLSGVAARKLARPIGALRAGALAVAGGSRKPIGATDAPAEFIPVFRAFDRMARDLAASEAQITRAERVLAWGEMARQVAHEIKNPLTPIRLGVQHLLRAWRDGRADFGAILEENSSRLLREIDHLDATARSFSRFGMTPEAPSAVETIDVASVVRDVVSLESMAGDGLEWRVAGVSAPSIARARAHELREVLINLCENARNATATIVDIRLENRGTRVVLKVVDDGEGVPPQLHARVFEPHFSTRTSGSGLGLAISRQLVESWGGSIDLHSEPGIGTTVTLMLDAPSAPPT